MSLGGMKILAQKWGFYYNEKASKNIVKLWALELTHMKINKFITVILNQTSSNLYSFRWGGFFPLNKMV